MKARRPLRSLGEGGWWLRRISQDTPQLAAGSFIAGASEGLLEETSIVGGLENAILKVKWR